MGNKNLCNEEKKKDFINILSSMTPKEINELIEQKGKDRKLVNPFIFLNK